MGGTVHFASGFRVGEVSQDSAIVWTRLTQEKERNWDGLVPSPLMSPTRVFVDFPDIPVSDWEGAVPGATGEIRRNPAVRRYADPIRGRASNARSGRHWRNSPKNWSAERARVFSLNR